MSKINHRPGERFGMLTIIREHQERKHHEVHWECLCDCGNQAIVCGYKLRSGHTQSCGCLQKKTMSALLTTHGRSNTDVYHVWRSMLARCSLQSDTNFKNYGARGITVCQRWRESFKNFIEDMGEPPGKQYSIERIEVNGPYCPSYCKWATRYEQHRNKRNNVVISFHGESMIQADFAQLMGVNDSVVAYWLHKGLMPEQIYTKFAAAARQRMKDAGF